MNIEVNDQHIEMLAVTMCAAFYANVRGAGWAKEPEDRREDWRRTARAAIRLLSQMPMRITVK